MELQLSRPLVFLDFETTGLDTQNDRIIELAFVKMTPDGSREVMSQRINPGVEVSKGAMAIGEGPLLGAWENAVHYFQQRKRWYLKTADGVRRIDVKSNAVQAIPVAAEVAEATLLRSCLSAGGRAEWPRLHSCWLSPEVPFVFELGRAKDAALPASLPAPG